MSDLDDRTECTLVMFADDPELGGAARPDACTAGERDLDKLKKW